MEDYQEIEEEYINDINNSCFENDKLCYILDEMKEFCAKHYLPFLKSEQTYQLFQNATTKM